MARRIAAAYQMEPLSALAAWSRRLAVFSLVATIVSVVIVRFGFLDFKPALTTFFGSLACAGLSILVGLAAFAGVVRPHRRAAARCAAAARGVSVAQICAHLLDCRRRALPTALHTRRTDDTYAILDMHALAVRDATHTATAHHATTHAATAHAADRG